MSIGGVLGTPDLRNASDVGVCERVTGPYQVVSRRRHTLQIPGWLGSVRPPALRNAGKTIPTSIGLVVAVARLCMEEVPIPERWEQPRG